MKQERTNKKESVALPESLITGVIDLPQDAIEDFTVEIRGDRRVRRITSPIEIPQEWHTKAEELGTRLAQYFDILKVQIIAEKPDHGLINCKGAFDNLIPAVDVLISEKGEWNLLEINTRPSSLGGLCLISDLLKGEQYLTPDGTSVPELFSDLLQRTWGADYRNSSVLISHPGVAFYRQHQVLAGALDIPIASFQELGVVGEKLVVGDEPKSHVLRQSSSDMFFKVSSPEVVGLWSVGGFDMIPGPLNQMLGEKSLLRHFPESDTWLPESYNVEQDTSVREYRNWWLKGRGGSIEAAIYLSESMTKGARRNFLDALISGQLDTAETELAKFRESSDGTLFSNYLAAAKAGNADSWILQENVEPFTINIKGAGENLRTMLRVHFVASGNPDKPYIPIMQMYAHNQRRVNASGYTIPLKLRR